MGRLALVVLLCAPLPVRHLEGLVHGFLVLRSLDGAILANGDLLQTNNGGRVTARLVFRFKDGSVHDETAVYTQRGNFKLQSVKLIQKGRTFPRQLEMSIDAVKGHAVVKHTKDGEQKIETEQIEIPDDLVNGMVLTVLKNVRPDAPPASVSYIAAAPKPTLIKLDITNAGQEKFSTGTTGRTATHYVLKPDIGGIKGVLAELLGKTPPDANVWILSGDVPAFVKSEQALYLGGPIWRIELVSPAWPKS